MLSCPDTDSSEVHACLSITRAAGLKCALQNLIPRASESEELIRPKNLHFHKQPWSFWCGGPRPLNLRMWLALGGQFLALALSRCGVLGRVGKVSCDK